MNGRFDMAGHFYILMTLLFTVYGQLVLKWQMGQAREHARRRFRQDYCFFFSSFSIHGSYRVFFPLFLRPWPGWRP